MYDGKMAPRLRHWYADRKRMLPDFVIIGAQKSGTSFFYNLLTRHPQIEKAATKEVHFFSRYYDLGPSWYNSHFPFPRQKDASNPLTGEATPYYLLHPLAARRAADTIPQARLIVMLRNPVDRAYSHYQHQVRMGNEPLPSFEEAIAAEGTRIEGEREKILRYKHYSSNSQFVCGSITSSNLSELVLGADNGGIGDNSRYPALSQQALSELQSALNRPSNPHFEFFDSSTHGYNLLDVTKEELICTMKAVSTTQSPRAQLGTLAEFRVPDGQIEIQRTDLP